MTRHLWLFLSFVFVLGGSARAVEVPWDAIKPEDVFSHELIIGFTNPESAGVTAQTSEEIGAKVTAVYDSIVAMKVAVPAGMTLEAAAAKYKGLPGVRYVEPNYRYHLLVAPNDPRYAEQWGLHHISADAAWDLTTGSDQVVVAVIDSGIDPAHPDFDDNVFNNYYQNPGDPLDGVDNDGNGYIDDVIGWNMFADPFGATVNAVPLDENLHGTHVAGTIGAIGNNGLGVAGVNWAVKILSLKIFGPGGAGSGGILQAIDYCTDNNIKISNNSWGGPFFSQALYEVIDRARAAGHLFVAAAGNDSSNNDTFPAYPASYDLDNIISVAALTEAGGLAGFSNYGTTTVDIAAPGDQILSTFPTYRTDDMAAGHATSYETISGTSMASPHVAGVAALLLSLNPSLTYDQLRDSIYAGAVTNPALLGQVDGGRELNALHALQNMPQQIRLDRPCYQTNALVTITISDGLTLPPINQIQAALQWLGSSTNLTLDRVGSTVDFETVFDLATLPPPPPVHGDQLLVTFTNLQGQVATTTALIDTVPPHILDFRVLNASDTEVRLQWRTDEAVSSELFIGTNVPIAVAVSGNLTETLEVQPDGSTQFVYRIMVSNLEQATKYFARLSLEDCAGNVSTYPSNLNYAVESDYLLFVTRVRRVVIESNFDQGPSGWTPGSLSGGVLWEHGVPSYGPFTANSPDFAWGTILNGRYLSEEKNAWVESPVLAVEEFPGIEFVAWYKINDFHPLSPGAFFPVPDLDFAMVEVNGGPGWINVTQLSDVLYGQIKVTGDGSAWQAFRIPLVGVVSNSTLQVRFRLETDEIGTAPGFYFDDFKVTDVALLGVSILEIRVDDSAGGDGDGFAEPGEAFILDMTVFNSEFTRTLTNVNATVGSIESGISVSLVNGSVSFGDIPAAAYTNSGNQIGVSLAPSIANETRATFFMSATADNGGPYAERFSLLIGDRETITGTVSNLFGGAGIDAATVRGTAAGHPDLVALTDSTGFYRLYGAVPGVLYEVFAGKPGGGSGTTITVTLAGDGGQSAPGNLNLLPDTLTFDGVSIALGSVSRPSQQKITFTVDLAGLSPGDYAVVADFLPGAAGIQLGTHTLAAFFSPSAPLLSTGPAFSVNFGLGRAFAKMTPANFDFELAQGREQTRLLRLDNPGNIFLDYEIVIDYADQAFSDWLSLSSSSGSLSNAAPQLVIGVTASAELLAVGLYQANLVLKSNDIGGQDIIVPVVLNVLSGPVLSLQRVEVSGGDGDPFAEAGEINDLTFTLVNSGSQTALDPRGILQFDAPTGLVIVVDNFANFPPIAPQRAGEALDPAAVALDPSVADGQVLDFKLTVSNDGQLWEFPFAITSMVRQAISGRVTTFTNPVMGVVGARVSARGPVNVDTQVISTNGMYSLFGLTPGSYEVIVDPPPPYSRPKAKTRVIDASNFVNVDFLVGTWDLAVGPDPFPDVFVDEGTDTIAVLSVTNNGPLAGTVDILVESIEDLPDNLIGELANVQVAWERLEAWEDYIPGELLVMYRDFLPPEQQDLALNTVGATVQHRYKFLPAVHVRVPLNQPLRNIAAALQAHPDVVLVEPNYRKELTKTPNDPQYSAQWGLENVRQTGGSLGADAGAEAFWERSVGSRTVTVSIHDTGTLLMHPDLEANLWVNPLDVPGEAAPADGAPGIALFDDDGDALESAEINVIDGIDNDGDGLVDETGIDFLDEEVMRADYNGNGIPLAGLDGVFGNLDDDTNDYPFAVNDDDENGYVDDIHGYDFGAQDNDPNPDTGFLFPVDGAEHGTHVAGTVGAVGNNDEGVTGMNWETSLMICKISRVEEIFGFPIMILDTAAVIKSLEYAVDNGARVSNHSYGGPHFSGIERAGIAMAGAKGHLFVAAAGNDGQDNDLAFPSYPASYNLGNLISVAAADHNDQLAAFSNFGAESVDLAAPGVQILSTWFQEDVFTGILLPDYETISGTSMASPHVCGAAALLLSIFPDATPAMLKRALLEGSRKDARLSAVTKSGGHLDLDGAFQAIQPFWLKPNPVSLTLDSGGSSDVDLLFNAGKHLVAGTYKANVYITEDRNNLRLPVVLHVNPAPAPVLVDVRVIDDVTGDGDHLAEPGETVDLSFTLTVEGSALFLNPTGHLSTATGGVTIVDATGAWPSMLSGQSTENSDTFTVSLGAGVSGEVPFTVRVGNASYGPFDLTFSLPVAPRHAITGTLTDSGGNGLAGESVEYWGTLSGKVTTDASGHYAIYGLTNGTYQVRALPQAHEKRDPTAVHVNGGDQVGTDISVRQVAVTPSTRDVVIHVPRGQAGQASFTLTNTSNDTFEYRMYEMPRKTVALISDLDQLAGLEPILTGMGFAVEVYNANERTLFDGDTGESYVGGLYSGNDEVVFNADLVIADLTGKFGSGRLLSAQESTVLNEYMGRGGRLILTGGNAVSSPDNRSIAGLVAGDSLDRDVVLHSLATATTNLPGARLFVEVLPGEQVAVAAQRYDIVDSSETNVLFAAGGADKLVRRELNDGGVAYLWGGNVNAAEWNEAGVWRDVLKDIVAQEMIEDQPWLFSSPVSASLGNGSHQIDVFADSAGMGEGTFEAVLMLDGNYPGSDTDYVRVTFHVEPLQFTAQSTSGVVDWQGTPIKGNGNENASVFQLFFAGPDGVISAPEIDGSPGGDDRLLKTLLTQLDVGRFGIGFGGQADQGVFSLAFEHDILPQNAARKVYVRAWDGNSVANSVVYGDSGLYELQLIADETHDFGSWTADTAPFYPGSLAGDINGDSVPDGYYIERGLDPRRSSGPLTQEIVASSGFGSSGTDSAEFRFPSRVFVTSTLVVVLDSQNDRVQVWNRATETFITAFGLPGTGNGRFSRPYGMAVHPTANRFAVLDSGSHRVQILNLDPLTGAVSYHSQFPLQVALGENQDARGIAIGPLGNYFIADTGNDRVQMYAPDGSFIQQFGVRGVNHGEFKRPEGIALDALGIIYIADSDNHRVQVFNGAGFFLDAFGSEGNGTLEFTRPLGIQVGQDGFIYVIDTSNSRVKIYDNQRNHVVNLSKNGDGHGELALPRGLYPSKDSAELYVADSWNHRVERFDLRFDGDGDGQDDLWEHRNGLDNQDPADALLDSDGDGVLNLGEYRIGTDPHDVDSDDDGVPDRTELRLGTDPADGASTTVVFLELDVDASPDITFTFSVRAGSTYRMEFNPDLNNPGGWAALAVPGLPASPVANQSMSVTLPGIGVDTMQHYRIVESTP